MACNCEGKVINIGMGCCTPVVANANHYYTKSEVDEKLDDIVASGCCITPEEVDDKISAATSGYATQQWVEDQGYLTEHQSLEGYVTENDLTAYTYNKESVDTALSGKQDTLIAGDNITISGNVISSVGSGSTDLSNYYNKEEIDAMLDDKATKTWVLNQHFVTNSELIQYINNLQIQINSLQESISGCCGGGGTGETVYRWITMTGENDYECSGTTKYTKEKKQQSTDNGVTWTDVTPLETRRGNTVLEENSVDCGYVPTNLKFSGVLRNGNTVEVHCDSSTTLSSGETHTTNSYTSIEIGNCVTTIGERTFINQLWLENITIPSGVTTIDTYAFSAAGNKASSFSITLNEGLVTIGTSAFGGCVNYSDLTIPNSVTTIGANAFSQNNISTLTIGSGVTSICTGAFAKSNDSTQFESVTVLATTPPTIEYVTFNPSLEINAIYVPAASVNAYKTAQYWSRYADRIQPIQ